ncbi:MAG: CBO2463/CBO2479 domain-containing protein [Thermovenabulum sp.]|uniref:CBO2463/CBO2479 domain-containing protein n=1 Tax=Thermovenabulum sp. TaxID=3100335 RepID=UPI003C7EB57B
MDEIYPGLNMIRGKIIEVTERDVKIEFKGRMGMLRVPLRMLISDRHPSIGDEVELMMSYVTLINDGR